MLLNQDSFCELLVCKFSLPSKILDKNWHHIEHSLQIRINVSSQRSLCSPTVIRCSKLNSSEIPNRQLKSFKPDYLDWTEFKVSFFPTSLLYE